MKTDKAREFLDRLNRIKENQNCIQPDPQIVFLLDYIAELEQSEKDYALAEKIIKSKYNAILEQLEQRLSAQERVIEDMKAELNTPDCRVDELERRNEELVKCIQKIEYRLRGLSVSNNAFKKIREEMNNVGVYPVGLVWPKEQLTKESK